jgi:aryl-alcohol dehydrogenase-like predicted oxidoreductase
VAEPHFIGSTQVSALGLGGASWSFADYAPWVAATPHPVDDDMAIQTIHAALDSGLTLIDTARVSAQALAQRKGISVYRLALAWLLSQSPTLIPLCGTGRPESIRDSALATQTALSEDDLATVDFAQTPRHFHGERRP